MKKFFEPLKLADRTILIIVAILGVISLITLESTVYDGGFVLDRSVVVQAVAYVLGFIALCFILHLDYNMFQSLTLPMYVLSILFLLTVYIPGLGLELYGARSWIDIGPTTIQPSEFVKIPFILLMANYLMIHREDIKKFRGVVLAGLYAVPIILIVLKEDLGSALVYMSIWIFMVFFAGIDYKILIKSIVGVVCAIPIAAGVFYNSFNLRLSPMLGALAMSFSSVFVVTNALRLRLFKAENKFKKEEIINMKEIIRIEGMMCSHCTGRVNDALNAIEGVEAEVSLENGGQAVVTYSENVSLSEIKKTIEDAGYKVID